MKRLILVYNPRATRYEEVEREVVEKSRKLKGWMICKFEVKKASVDENAEILSEILRKGDLVVSAGGDGTACMALNAIMKSGVQATLGVMGYGNFNDYQTTFGKMNLKRIVRKFEEGRFEDLYPLEVKVNGKHFLFAGLYFSMGMFAEAVGVFEKRKVREKIGKVKNRLNYSANKLFHWYLVNKWRRDLLAEMEIEKTIGEKKEKIVPKEDTTDYVALNGESLAGVVSAEGWTEERKAFWSGEMRNRSFFRMLKDFVKSEADDVLPGERTEGDIIRFKKPSKVFLHIEGERTCFEEVEKVEVFKPGDGLRIIRE